MVVNLHIPRRDVDQPQLSDHLAAATATRPCNKGALFAVPFHGPREAHLVSLTLVRRPSTLQTCRPGLVAFDFAVCLAVSVGNPQGKNSMHTSACPASLAPSLHIRLIS
jgi:hypothetical protein